MAGLQTGIDLPTDYWDNEATTLSWWVTSIPPYYAINESTDPNSDNLNIDRTWLGPNYWDGSTFHHPTSPGIKFCHTFGSSSQAGGAYSSAPTFFSSSAAGRQQLVELNKGNGIYNTKTNKIGECLRPGTYTIGSARDPLFFGPYNLDLTRLPNADGDLLLIMTGSDVLGGSSGSGNPYDDEDHRAFNLLFYYTGSEQVDIQNLTGKITGVPLDGYDASNRGNWIASTKFGMAFVGASGSGATRFQCRWWPITWDPNEVGPPLNSTNNN